jgi:signal transduction histidine kinase
MTDIERNTKDSRGVTDSGVAPALHVLIAILTVATVVLISWLLATSSPSSGITTISPSTIEVFEANADRTPKLVTANVQTTSLAHERILPYPRFTQYRMLVQYSSVPEAVLVLGVGGQTQLFVNSIAIGKSQPNLLPNPVQGSQQILSLVPSNLFKPGANRIDFVMAPSPWRTGIGVVQVGSFGQVEAAAQAHEVHQRKIRTLALIAGFVGLASVVVLIVVGRAWAASLSGILTAAYLLTMYFLGEGLFLPDFMVGALGWGDVGMIVAGLFACLSIQAFRGWVRFGFLGLGIALILAGLLALLGWRFSAPFALVSALMQVAPVAMAGIGIPVLAVQAIRQLIADQVQSRAEAVRQSVLAAVQAEQLERQAEWQAVIEERKRFTRDIHDGIGGQLVSLLSRVRYEAVPQDELAAELENGIADLRLVADALDEGPVSLSIALWNFSVRARQQLISARMDFHWDLPNDLDIEWHDARRVLSLYRMLQECVSNAVRHAKAKSLSIQFTQVETPDCPALQVTIEDDGVGFDPDQIAAGRGLINLKTRTKMMGGIVTLSKLETGYGTRILITVPITADATP